MEINKIRLQKAIANYGYCSRRHAEKLIIEKRIKVNDVIVSELGTKVTKKDIIKVDDKIISLNLKKLYFLFNKPRSVVTTTKDPKKRKTIMHYFSDISERIYPIGRLDYDTTGLILLTNDGEFANIIAHPKHEINKKYLVVIDGKLDLSDKTKLETGVTLPDGKLTSNSEIKILNYNLKSNKSYLEITIHEGRNHQIKNMFLAVNHKVLKLSRIEIGPLKIDNLTSGKYRTLTNKEVEYFFKNFN